jgi:hypothetical protein
MGISVFQCLQYVIDVVVDQLLNLYSGRLKFLPQLIRVTLLYVYLSYSAFAS